MDQACTFARRQTDLALDADRITRSCESASDPGMVAWSCRLPVILRM